MKKILSLLIIAMMLVGLLPATACAAEVADMAIYFIDCGQGDAIFISSEQQTMLVDAGKASNAHKVLSFLDAQGIEELDYVFSSHPDEDHIGGMPEVYANYQVNNSVYPAYSASTKIYSKYLSAVQSEPSSRYEIADASDRWTLGDAGVEVVSDGEGYSNPNDASVVLKVTCGARSLLLTGDISKTAEEDLVESGKDLDIDILKVGHHGSASSSSAAFLAATSPDVAVISVGAGNSYGHPTQAALTRLSAVCSNIYRTDQNGTVLLKVADDKITFNNSTLETPSAPNCAEKTVYVSAGGTKYHASASCSNMKAPLSKTLTAAKKAGYTACSKCISSGFETTAAHSYRAATCTKPKTCKVCGKTSGSKLGHSYKKVITKATLTKNGKIQNKCKTCGYVASKVTAVRRASSFKLSTTTYTYNGKVKTPSVTVKDTAGKVLKKGTDYVVTYSSGRKNVSTYKVKITFKGNYSGSKTLTFKVNPAKTTLSKLTAGSKKLTVSITKKKTQVSGYQLQYSTSKKFTSAKTKTTTATKVTLKGLKAKKTYYVRVRTYKTVSGKKYYSGWSTIKYKKTK